MRFLKLSQDACGQSLWRRGFASLVVADHDNDALLPTSLSTLAAAKLFQKEVVVLVTGATNASKQVAIQASLLKGVSKVVHMEHEDLATPTSELIAAAIVQAQQQGNYEAIFGSTSSLLRDAIPYAASKLDVQPLADVSAIVAEEGEGGAAVKFQRPIYAGNAIATVVSMDKPKMATIRHTCFSMEQEVDETDASSCPIESLPLAGAHVKTKVLKQELDNSDSPKLASARIVVSGGRGLRSKENFDRLIGGLSHKLKAAVGASRAAVDAGYVSNDLQVGQTGKVVAPDLYIAIGISGAIQHLAGMKDSKVIVAINKDHEAPICKIADYSIFGDLFKIVPELTQKLG